MVADLHASAYLVDGGALAATGVALTHEGAGLWTPAAEDIGTATVPGADGAIDLGSLFRPYTLSIMYLIRGTGFTDVWAKIQALRGRCKPGQSVTLTRLMPDPDGTDNNTSLTTTGRRQTDRPDWLNSNGSAAALDIDWLITGGPFYGPAVAIADAAGAHTIIGQVRTHRMTITLAAGAARTISNSTNGFYVQFLTTVPTGGVLIDVEARTATAITGGADLSAYLQWGKKYPMRLEAGSNTLALDAGSASISYQPAYL